MAVDTTGLNSAKIAAMKNAIEAWADAVDRAKITVSSKNVTKAIKGSTQQAQVKSLCQACDSYANSLTSKLRKYEQRLDEVRQAYVSNDNNATAISSVTSQIKNLKS